MNEKFYIEITYNEKMVLGTFLFNSEAEAVSWWEKVSTIDELVTGYLLKETRKENEFNTNTEVVRSLK